MLIEWHSIFKNEKRSKVSCFLLICYLNQIAISLIHSSIHIPFKSSFTECDRPSYSTHSFFPLFALCLSSSSIFGFNYGMNAYFYWLFIYKFQYFQISLLISVQGIEYFIVYRLFFKFLLLSIEIFKYQTSNQYLSTI